MLSKFIKVLLSTLLIVFSFSFTAFAEGDVNINVQQISFVDINNDYWANNAITSLAQTNVINGYEDHTFRPNNPVTREEFATLITKTFYLDLPSTDVKPSFYDVQSDRWSFTYIEAAKEFLTGYYTPSGKAIFNPAIDATREDVAVALVKTLGYQPDDLQNPNILDDKFYDVTSISPNLKTYVALAVEKQLFNGYPDGTFKGDNPVTRAEVASLLYKVIKNAATDGNTDVKLDVSIPETTNSSTVYVTGDTTKGATVTINNEAVEVIQGKFSQGYKLNQEGKFSITVVARLSGGKTKTVTKEITYVKGGPELIVENVPESSIKQTITVSWSVKDENDSNPKVYINDQPQYSWDSSADVSLNEGANTIVIKAVNSQGKSTIITKTVNFNSDSPVLKVGSIPDTTEKTSVSITWSVSDRNDPNPKVYVNDQVQYSWTTSSTINLVEGVNTIVIKAVSSLGKVTAITKTISLNSGAPILKIGDIASTTDLSVLNVSWQVSDKNDSSPKVYINDQAQYSWTTSASLNLNVGDNVIVFKATNNNGKVTVVTRNITFNPAAPKLTVGYMPASTAASFITLTWTIVDKNDSNPKIYINDELQSYWQQSKSFALVTGANPITFIATNSYGKQTSVTNTVYH